MRPAPWTHLDKYRLKNANLWSSDPGDDFGAFFVKRRSSNVELRIVASPGDSNLDISWEHVSVSLANRCPTWDEMCYVKSLFWRPDETVIQFHPRESEYINYHPHTLHLWKPTNFDFPLPPAIAIGPKK